MHQSSALPVLMFLHLYVIFSPCAHCADHFYMQYATNLEALAFPDTPLIVKVAKRALYRTN